MDSEVINQAEAPALDEPIARAPSSTPYEKSLIERWRVGAHYGGAEAAARRREYLVYAAIKQGGALVALGWIALNPTGWVQWSAFALFFFLNILGESLGYHRYFTHAAFETSKPMRYALGILAQCAVFGSLRHWCTDHRRHHAFSDHPGDTHSPHVNDQGKAHSGAKGLVHAHVKWAYGDVITNMEIYGKGILDDPVIDWCHKTRYVWFAVSVLVLPALWALAFAGPQAILGTVLVAGFLRVALVAHTIFAINSFGHVYGYRNFALRDQARNNLLLGYLTLGEGWHNNHHAHPRSAFTGVRPHEIDVTGWVIRGLELLGLVWNVQRADKSLHPAQ